MSTGAPDGSDSQQEGFFLILSRIHIGNLRKREGLLHSEFDLHLTVNWKTDMLLPTFLSCKCFFLAGWPSLIILESYKCHLMEIKGGIRVSLRLDWRGQEREHWGRVIYPADLCLKMVCGDTKTLWRYHGESPWTLNLIAGQISSPSYLNSFSNLIM